MSVKPYNPNDDDPYAQSGVGNDSNTADPNGPGDTGAKPPTPPKTPTAYTPPDDQPPDERTFADLEATGKPRPPAPTTSTDAVTNMLSGTPTEITDELPPGGGAPPPPPPVVTPTIDPTTLGPTDTGGQGPTTTTQLASRGGAPDGVDADWWNTSGLGTFTNIFQQTTGRAPTQEEIQKYGGAAAAGSWDDVPAMLKAAGLGGAPPPPPGDSGTPPPTDPATPPGPTGPTGPTTKSTVPAGVDPGWWNGSGLATFTNIFESVAGRPPTQGDIDKYGAKAAAGSWNALAPMLEADGLKASKGTIGPVGPTKTTLDPLKPPGLDPTVADSILPLLTGKAGGTAPKSPVDDATTKAILGQFTNPNPFNSDEVKREYSDLGAGIDADFDTRQRNTSNEFARRGLFGSVGKDFASGRAADTEVGRRTAKTQLASDLAKAQAISQGQYQNAAINQGQTATNSANANQLDWLRSLMGYGNDAFNHDLQTANFQQNQNESEQDYLLRLLQAGYGV